MPGPPEYAIARALAAGAKAEPDLPKIGILWVNAVRVILSQPGSGRMYGSHQASAPGQPPAVDTGAYRASWTHRALGLSVSMYPDLPAGDDPAGLGGWLEYGTSKMAARPHARVASAQVAPLIGRVVADGIIARERAAA